MPQTTTIQAVEERLSPIEEVILGALGGKPWTSTSVTPEELRNARATLRRVRRAAGFRDLGRWVTTHKENPKMSLGGAATIGVTLHAATNAAVIWGGLTGGERERIASALGVTSEDVANRLRLTFCPFSTKACRGACVTSESANAQVGKTPKSRLVRTLMHVYYPDEAFTLLGAELVKFREEHGEDARWRVNISDDVRWELVAPGLFEFQVPGYAYTKWAPERRSERDGLSVVYSATDRTTTEEIRAMLAAGHRVAVVFDVTKKEGVPATWQGMPVVNGDRTDDLYEHPYGVIVGLRAKAPTKAILQRMRECGFSRPV